MKAAFVIAVVAFTALWPRTALPETSGADVDLLLVLAADVSGSMNRDLRQAQRRGFASAFRETALRHAVGSGPSGAVAITYFEWAGPSDQHVVLPWTRVSDADDLERIARRLETAPHAATGTATSISGALFFAADLLDDTGFRALRKVVDISGNGRNDSGPELAEAHARLRAAEATVNGLALSGPELADRGPYASLFAGYDGPLDGYFRAEVIVGPGAFAMSAERRDDYARWILRKLVLEIAATRNGGSPV